MMEEEMDQTLTRDPRYKRVDQILRESYTG